MNINIELFFFYFFSSITLISAIMVIGSKNPIHSVLFLILVFFNITGLLILIHVEFLAITFLIVYVGAVAVLFLFVVMMLNIKTIEINENIIKYLPIGGTIGLIFFFELFLIINNGITLILNDFRNTATNMYQYLNWFLSIEKNTNIEAIGKLLYTNYASLFIISGLILLLAMLSAIVLTISTKPITTFNKKQSVYNQVTRDYKKSLYIMN